MIKADQSSLNPPQREAVQTLEGPILILAGAGTGKTKVITHRIAHMIEYGVDDQKIVAVTFTNKAAREMKHRVQGLVGKGPKLFIGTFHRFCIGLLRKYHQTAHLPVNFGISSSNDQLDFVKKSLGEKKWGGLYDAYSLVHSISKAKNALLRPHEIDSLSSSFKDDPNLEVIAAVYELYERHLVLNRCIDFDDCIFKAALLLRDNPDVQRKVHLALTHFMVDEFQDTNLSQLKLIELLVGQQQNICVVGDDDQSIYSWRGAIPGVIQSYQQLYPKTKKIKLEQNYRCTQLILNAANAVIKNNEVREDKKLWSDKTDDKKIKLAQFREEKEEANWVATKCLSLNARGVAFKDICVLLRTNGQAKPIELSMRAARVPVLNLAGQSFFERKEIKDYMAYLKLILNLDDHLSLWRIINSPSRGIGMKTLEKIEACSNHLKASPFKALLSEDLVTTPKTRHEIHQFHKKILRLRELALSGKIDTMLTGILSEFKLIEALRVSESSSAKQSSKIAALKNVPDWLSREVEQMENAKTTKAKLANLIDMISLDQRGESEETLKQNSIKMMTVHAAKGLEYDYVFVPGLEEGLFPHRNSIEEDNVSEERRLFYVALTRAKEQVFVSHARERTSGFKSSLRKISRFINEIKEANEELMEWEGQLSSEPASKSMRVEKIRSLKDFLKQNTPAP